MADILQEQTFAGQNIATVMKDMGDGTYAPVVATASSITGAIFLPLTASSSGATTLVAAVANKMIRVLSVVLISNGTVNVKFQSHVIPTDITGLFYLIANTGFSSGYSAVGQFQTISGEALDINLSASIAVGGYIVYILV